MSKNTLAPGVHLTAREQVYFDLLVKNPEGVHVEDFMTEDSYDKNIVAAHMRNLRAKIKDTHEVFAIRGFGYQMRGL